MAEVVEYRLEKSIDELNLLVEFGLFNKDQAKEILSKRQNYEYILRRRNRTKLDFLKYIRFEINLLESIDKYRKVVIKDFHNQEDKDDLDRKILLLQAKKLKDVVRSRCAHVSSLFRRLTIKFQFDKKLWLAYIEFAKSRGWHTRVSALYWRLLRVSGDQQDIWLNAASHEIKVNRAFDSARGLYLRALRHHPKSSKIWAEYFLMEVQFMEVVDQRARILFRMSKGAKNTSKETETDIWAEKELEQEEPPSEDEEEEETFEAEKAEILAAVKTINEDDVITTGKLPRIIYINAVKSLDSKNEYRDFILDILIHLLTSESQSEGLISLRDYVVEDIRQKVGDGDDRISKELAENCDNLEFMKEYVMKINNDDLSNKSKRVKKNPQSKMNLLYECYEAKGIKETRKMYIELEKSIRDQTLSLYVGMIQVESWQYVVDHSVEQRNRIRAIYDKALVKFGIFKTKLWYEYLQFEHENAKSLEDFERVNQIYLRAQSTVKPEKVDRVIEKYTLLQNKSSSADIEYSDYSDLEE